MLKDRVMQREKGGREEVRKDRKKILKKKKAKRKVEMRQIRVERKERKEKLLREVTVKIGLKQKEEEEEIVVNALLDSRVTRLVMSEEFVRKHKFRRTNLERLIYIRNVDGTTELCRANCRHSRNRDIF